MDDDQRARLMTETAVDLAMQGYDLGAVLREFAKVDCFRTLGGASFPMCRALTTAMLGRSYEPNTMSFEELLVAYAPAEGGVTVPATGARACSGGLSGWRQSD
jgi:hypothetical protein